jgi:hypothetical protein
MTTERLLNSIGKATFIKYYYAFKNQSREYCIKNFEERKDLFKKLAKY